MGLFFEGRQISFNFATNLSILVIIPSAALQAFFRTRTGFSFIEWSSHSFVFVGSFFRLMSPIFLLLGTRFLFESSRGPPIRQGAIWVLEQGFALMWCARSFVMVLAQITGRPRFVWFKSVERSKRPVGEINKVELVIYTIVGFLIWLPVIAHNVAWALTESIFDYNFLASFCLLYTAYGAFFGVWRTVRRLKKEEVSWQCDHIYMNMWVPLVIIPFCFYYVFGMKGVEIWDLISIAHCALACAAVVMSALAFGTCGSYLSSFLFVYFTILRPNYGSPESECVG
jgi:hypothetical protein